jgi:hypothetical protein
MSAPIPLQSVHDAFEEELLGRLSFLPYLGFECVASELLRDLGYSDIQFTGRIAKRGRKPKGGVDFFASIETPVTSSRVVVQIKQYKIQRRHIDELRGTMVRHGGTLGIIISTHRSGRTAQEVASSFRGRPVRIVDGHELAKLMIEHGLGVQVSGFLNLGDPWYEIDQEYFQALERLGAAQQTDSSKQGQQQKQHKHQQLFKPASFHSLLATLRAARKQSDLRFAFDLVMTLIALAGALVLLSTVLKHLLHLPLT